MQKRTLMPCVLALLLGTLPVCGPEPEGKGPQLGSKSLSAEVSLYKLAVHPLHNPAKLTQERRPLIDFLNGRLPGARLDVEPSRDCADFEANCLARNAEFLLPNPSQTLQAMKVGYRVIAMAGDPEDFKGIFVVRRDSSLKHPADLKETAVSYPSPTALAACVMPQHFLHNHGINVKTDIDSRYVGSQESSVMNASMGLTAEGPTWPPPWRACQKDRPPEAAE